jgi:hypothetical protein
MESFLDEIGERVLPPTVPSYDVGALRLPAQQDAIGPNDLIAANHGIPLFCQLFCSYTSEASIDYGPSSASVHTGVSASGASSGSLVP